MPVSPEKTSHQKLPVFLWDLIPGSNWKLIASGYIGVHMCCKVTLWKAVNGTASAFCCE